MLSSPRIKKPTSHECNQGLELLWRQIGWVRQERVDPLKYRLDRTEAMSQVVINPGSNWIVTAGKGKRIQVVANRIRLLP